MRSSDLPLAPAVAGPGARVGRLALMIGLNPAQYGRWLSRESENASFVLADGRTVGPKGLRPEHELAEGQVLAVPNVIAAIWAPGVGEIGRAVVDWEEDLDYLRHRGFQVREFESGEENRGEAFAGEVVRSVREASEKRFLHGLFVTAHGNGTQIGDNCGTLISIRDFRLVYQLGFVLVNTCEAERALTLLASPHAAAYGVPGLMVPPFETGHPRAILPPGAQGTRPAPTRRPRRRAS